MVTTFSENEKVVLSGALDEVHVHPPEGGSPGDDAFNADAYLAGLEKLTAVGVTWVQVGLPGDSLAHALDIIERFGKSVIGAR